MVSENDDIPLLTKCKQETTEVTAPTSDSSNIAATVVATAKAKLPNNNVGGLHAAITIRANGSGVYTLCGNEVILHRRLHKPWSDIVKCQQQRQRHSEGGRRC